MRVKLWSTDGADPLLRRAGADRRGATASAQTSRSCSTSGGADAELSDLSSPRTATSAGQGKLLEAHTTIRTPDGTQVLFEIYQRFGVGQRRARARLLRRLRAAAARRPARAAAVPGAARVVAGARPAARPRASASALLAGAVEASERERRRIAADLHDGVVQDLAGVAFGLAPLADEAAPQRRRARGRRAARAAADTLRQGVRDLRTLLVEIHPPNLATAGLSVALSDLLSPLQADGHRDARSTSTRRRPAGTADALVYRVAREAMRNARAHAGARRGVA